MTPDRLAAVARDIAQMLQVNGRAEDRYFLLLLPAPRQGYCGVVDDGQATIVAIPPEEALDWAREVIDRVQLADLAGEADA